MNPFRKIYRTWVSGVLICFAGLGYIFYSILIILRMLQTKKIVLGLFIALFLAAAFILVFFMPCRKLGDQEIIVTVEPGATVRTIAVMLREKNVIPSKKAFLLWIKLSKTEKKIQAGRYRFHENEGIFSAVKKLRSAEPVDTSITIPEGLTIEQTAAVIAAVVFVDTAEFIVLCNDTDFIEGLGINAPSLEGYLYPNTYRFGHTVKTKEIIARMVKQFMNVYRAIPQTEAAQRYTQSEIVTLASIVEKEATLASERSRISGVFHNRLRLGMPLGADPTVRYAIKKFSGPLRVSELQNPSPYNTRIHKGLPPGPICSPGRGALEAAIAPMDTKELYFVAKWDGTGAHDFSLTNAQHDRKKLEIRQKNYLRKKEKMKE